MGMGTGKAVWHYEDKTSLFFKSKSGRNNRKLPECFKRLLQMGSLHCAGLSRDGGGGAGCTRLKPNTRLSKPKTLCAGILSAKDGEVLGNCVHVIMRTACSDATFYPLRPQEAVSAATDEERLVKIHNVIQQLPPPHYRSGLWLTVAPWWYEAELFVVVRRRVGNRGDLLRQILKYT